MVRPSGRQASELRTISIERNVLKHTPGSVLIKFGNTHVLCSVSHQSGVPKFLKGTGSGWLTAEYGMLPNATGTRTQREATSGKQSGRTQEIQRLIGRCLRQCVNLKALGEHTLTIDCDVLQADGGTRTAGITGACIALEDALTQLHKQNIVKQPAFIQRIAAVSVGIYKGHAVLDLDYLEDSEAETDMNVIMTGQGHFVEVQGAAEKTAFTAAQLHEMLALGDVGIKNLLQHSAALREQA